MKRVLVAAVAVATAAGMATPAAAQDANGRGWGCYIGAHFAERWASSTFRQTKKVITLGTPAGPSASGDFGSQSPDAAGYGAQFGCDYHAGPWVYGAQIQHDNGVAGTNALTAFPTFNMRASITSIETVTGRLGYMVAPDLLAYARGGVAVAIASYQVNQTGVGLSEYATSLSRLGYVFGGGLEYNLTNEWSVYGEFTNSGFGSVPTTFTASPGTVGNADVVRIRQSINQLMIGVNFHF